MLKRQQITNYTKNLKKNERNNNTHERQKQGKKERHEQRSNETREINKTYIKQGKERHKNAKRDCLEHKITERKA